MQQFKNVKTTIIFQNPFMRKLTNLKRFYRTIKIIGRYNKNIIMVRFNNLKK